MASVDAGPEKTWGAESRRAGHEPRGRMRLWLSLLTGSVICMVFAAQAAAAPLPSISALTISPSSVPHGGGTVMVKAKVKHSASCRLSSSPSLSGLPSSHSCSSGTVTKTLHIGSAPSAAARHFTITLKASRSGHSVTKVVHLSQKGELPTVSQFTASVGALPDSGGNSDLTATVAHASSCKLTVVPALTGFPAVTSCSSSFADAVALPANTTTSAVAYHFTLTVSGPGGAVTVSTHPLVTVAGEPAPITGDAASPAPLPSNAETGASESVALTSVSCGAAASCAAVGTYYGTADGEAQPLGLIETLTASGWTAQQAPYPADISTTTPQINLSSVSCWAAGSCTAVGEYVSTNGWQPYVAVLAGGTWTPQITTTPVDSSYPQYRLNGDLNSVSCDSFGACVAVGYYNPPENESALIEQPSSTAGTWDGIAAPLPENAQPIGSTFGNLQHNYLNSVSCLDDGNCTAVGGYVSGEYPNNGDEQILADTLYGAGWTATEGEGAGIDDDKLVSCAGSSCLAASSFGYLQSDSEQGGAWSWGSAVPSPVPSPSSGSAAITAAACAGNSFCAAVGTYYTSDTQYTGLIDTGSGSSYTAIAAAQPGDANPTDPDLDPTAISCAGTSGCVAVGTYHAGTSGTGTQLVETGSHIGPSPTWTGTSAPLPTDGQQPYGLTSVSCVAGYGCVAVGQYGNTKSGFAGELLAIPL